MRVRLSILALAGALAACGGGSAGPGSSVVVPQPSAAVQVSGASPAQWGSCGSATSGLSGEAFASGSAVQPQVALRPGNATQAYAVWEQDRWNAIGARGILFSSSSDGGATWSPTPVALPFSRCGSALAPGGLYDRVSDPSVAAGTASGSAFVVASALAFSAAGFGAAGGTSAVLVSRSTDGGITWGNTQALISDAGSGAGPYYFNDRDAVAADPNSSHVYVLWDRISTDVNASNPTWMAHSADGGVTWDPARVIFSPGAVTQTFNNQPLVLPDGSVLDIFTIRSFGASLVAIRSTDHGTTWSAPGQGIASGYSTITASMSPAGTANPIAGGPPIRDSAYMAQVAVDPSSGTIAVVWQESSFSGGVRDAIALSVSTDLGATWSTPVAVNGRPDLAAFDPSVRFDASGRLAITYYDFRDCNSACTSTLNTGAWMRVSPDRGRTWSADARLAGPFDLLKAPPADATAGTVGNSLFLGDQQGLAGGANGWITAFAATTAAGAVVQAVRVP